MEENSSTIKPKFSLWRIISPPLVFLGVQILVDFIASFFASFIVLSGMAPDILTDGFSQQFFYDTIYPEVMNILQQNMWLISMATCLFTMAIMLLMIRQDKKQRYKAGTVSVYETAAPMFFVIVFILGASASCTANSILSLSGLEEIFAEDMEQVEQATYSGVFILDFLLLTVLAPATEELIFRGMVYERLRERFNMVPSMLVSACLFGAFHGNIVQFIYAAGLGILMAYVYERFHSIWASILFHVGTNMFSVLAVYTNAFGLGGSGLPEIILIAVMAIVMVGTLSLIHDKLDLKALIPAKQDET